MANPAWQVRFLAALAVAVLAVPLAAGAQPPARTPRIGVLAPDSRAAATAGIEGFRASLRELGYVEGRTIAVEFRWADGQEERLPGLAAELVALKVDVIVTAFEPAIRAARKATTTIPIVMAASLDAVRLGLVDSFARPGGNVTGLSVASEILGKQFDLLRELIPSLSRVVILVRHNPEAAARRAQAKTRAQELLGLTLDLVEVREPADFARAFATASASRPDAMIVAPEPLFFVHRDQIVDLARTARLPVIYPVRDFVEGGGLVSFSPSVVEMFRRSAYFVDRILKGAQPADLPVEQPTKFDLVINLKTAKALNLTIPRTVLIQADKVIR